MNRQREIIVTVTYNDLGIIVDAKAEPRKKGKWIPHDCLGRPSIDKDVCSCCGQRFYQIAETGCEWNFCPNCGSYNGGEQ